MKRSTHKHLPPARVAALVAALCLLVCGGGCVAFYVTTAYLPLLLAGILQLLPAVVNLLLLIPVKQQAETPPATEAETADGAEDDPAEPTERKRSFRALLAAAAALPRRIGGSIKKKCAVSRATALAALILLTTVGAAVAFFLLYRSRANAFGIGYHLPVILLAIFVLYIVLDKWCKHVDEDKRPAEGEPDLMAYDRALLRGLRGGLAAGRWAAVVLIAVLMIRLMGYMDLTGAVKVVLALLFAYEAVFLLVSLFVRIVRREMDTAPELSIPMPGLGRGDLGVISYLEKNTGMTMRSLWSIRLVKHILPYGLMGMVLLLWGFSGVVRIDAHQQGAHYRLGCLQEETLQPGIHMTLPWPFDQVEVYDTEVVNTVTIGYLADERSDNIWTEGHGSEEYRLLLGGGNELVSVNLRVAYRIDDLREYLTYSASPESMLQAVAYEAVTARTIGTDLNTLLATDRTAFSQSFKEELIERLAVYHTGLAVTDVVLESIHPPVEIADVYQQLISAEIEAERILLSANGQATVLLTEAEGDKYKTVGEAEAEQLRQVAAANASVAEFMGAVEANASWDGYMHYKYLQAISKAYGDGRVVIVGDGVNSSNIYIGNVPLTGNGG